MWTLTNIWKLYVGLVFIHIAQNNSFSVDFKNVCVMTLLLHICYSTSCCSFHSLSERPPSCTRTVDLVLLLCRPQWLNCIIYNVIIFYVMYYHIKLPTHTVYNVYTHNWAGIDLHLTDIFYIFFFWISVFVIMYFYNRQSETTLINLSLISFLHFNPHFLSTETCCVS